MSNKLYISDDAPVELKDVISVAQRMVDNMAECKAKADAGTLSMDDLKALTHRNNAISGDFPRAAKQPAGYPSLTSDMDELKALTKARALESEAALAESGGPVLRVDSLEELKTFATLSPRELGEKVMMAAKAGQEQEEIDEETERKPVSQDIKLKHAFASDLLKENLEGIRDLLYQAKLILFEFPQNWLDAEAYEKQLHLNARAFKGNKQRGIDLLQRILNGEEEEEDLEDKKAEAAFILASLATEAGRELEKLISCWQDTEELSTVVLQALKYAVNPVVSEWVQSTFPGLPAEIKPGLVEVLMFRQQINCEQWEAWLDHEDSRTCSKMYHACANAGFPLVKTKIEPLWADPEAEVYEEALFAALLSGHTDALISSRIRLAESPEKTTQLPLFFSCGCAATDAWLIKRCLDNEEIREAVVKALGMLGLPRWVPDLIDLMETDITCREDWDRQRQLVDSLELITGARLELLFPEIKEGPEGKEYEVTVHVDWKHQWYGWWLKNRNRFETGVRYRRGALFTLERCIDEMECPMGNYWSRQYAYYELQIRSGQHLAAFFADWNVKDQLNAVKSWRMWWEDHKNGFPDDQWLFNGNVQ